MNYHFIADVSIGDSERAKQEFEKLQQDYYGAVYKRMTIENPKPKIYTTRFAGFAVHFMETEERNPSEIEQWLKETFPRICLTKIRYYKTESFKATLKQQAHPEQK